LISPISERRVIERRAQTPQKFCYDHFSLAFMMSRENSFNKGTVTAPSQMRPAEKPLHSAWRAFIEYCAELQHGEIEILKIQDGLPVLAEVVRKKVKFAP
jgi:hypothetical protein